MREMAQKLIPIDSLVSERISKGDLEGIPLELKLHLKYDRLSPGLKELLTAKAIKTFKSEYNKHKNIRKALEVTAKAITSLWRELNERVRYLVETFKPIYIPPKMMVGIGPKARFTDKPLYAEEIGCWIEEIKPYTFLTYWFRFPYDIWPGDGAEYEPWSIVIEEDKIVEYQARTHWRIVHINPKLVLHAEKRPLIAFVDHAHTPVPILDVDNVCSLLHISIEELLENLREVIEELKRKTK